jgi:predicted transcriptional regulator
MISTKKFETIIHPVRLRIIRLLQNDPMTTVEIGNRLSDIPQATLYRNIDKLIKTGFIKITEEKKVRGAIERTLVLSNCADTLSPEDMKHALPEDFMHLLTLY